MSALRPTERAIDQLATDNTRSSAPDIYVVPCIMKLEREHTTQYLAQVEHHSRVIVMGGSRMKGGCRRSSRRCHSHRLGSELLASAAAAVVVIAATRTVVGAAVAGRVLLRLLLLLLVVVVVRRAGS